jgi:hypothetical protein
MMGQGALVMCIVDVEVTEDTEVTRFCPGGAGRNMVKLCASLQHVRKFKPRTITLPCTIVVILR